jgi:hypothetical protein
VPPKPGSGPLTVHSSVTGSNVAGTPNSRVLSISSGFMKPSARSWIRQMPMSSWPA